MFVAMSLTKWIKSSVMGVVIAASIHKPTVPKPIFPVMIMYSRDSQKVEQVEQLNGFPIVPIFEPVILLNNGVSPSTNPK